MHERAFVLMPLLEIAPDVTIPEQGDVKNLLARCRNQEIEKI
jgi:2-amino-4-hydroxy-6-hydroxymethyldihydropteridine diphosphokinase